MTERAISPLRRRMIDDMKIRGIGQKTQEDYIRAIRNFTRFFGASPDRAGFEDLRRYQLHMRNQGIGATTINSTLSALRFLFKVTLRQAEDVDQLRYVREPRKLPVVLSHEEVARLLAYAPGLKYKAALGIAYGAGLRASEVVNLRINDIDSERMVIRVEQGMIVPGGGLALDGNSWIDCKPGFFLPVRVLSALFRRLMLEKLKAAHHQGKLRFFGDHEKLCDKRAFATYLAPLKKTKWFVYSKEPFKGPAATLAYLGRYTHRVAIANNRLIKADDNGVTFHYKDYRNAGRFKRKIMTITPFEFIRRFLIHILPDRFHRIRHYGLFANGQRAANLNRIRDLLEAPSPNLSDQPVQDHDDLRILRFPCPACGGRMIIIDSFEPGAGPPDHKTDTERINAA